MSHSGDDADATDPPADADSDTYVHEPSGPAAETHQPRNRRPDGPPPSDEFDWRGWVLVGTIVFAFVVAPGILYLLPAARGVVSSLGLGLRTTYLVLPLLPAIGLAVVAVWSAVRSRAE